MSPRLMSRRKILGFPVSRSFHLTTVLCSVLFVSVVAGPPDEIHRSRVHYMNPDDTVKIHASHVGGSVLGPSAPARELDIFCFRGFPSVSPQHVFSSMKLLVESKDAEMRSFSGKNFSEVYEDYKASMGWFGRPKLFGDWGPPYSMRLYEESCVGIHSQPPYLATLQQYHVDFLRLCVFLAGLLVFFKARLFCVNTGVYYGSGMCLGILCSVIILVFILGRRINRKSVAISFMVGGWSLALYMLNMAKDNMLALVTAYSTVFGIYCALCALLTFFLMYRYQPMRHPRSIDILEWILQTLGGFMMFSSSEVKEFGLMAVLLALGYSYFPASWSMEIRERVNAIRYRYTWFRPTHRYLTEQEYIDQGVVETRRELKKLREYCSSPNCNAWKTVNRLKDPKRFADFVDGGQHINDDEILDYDRFDPRLPSMVDDDDDDDNDGDIQLDSYSRTPGRVPSVGNKSRTWSQNTPRGTPGRMLDSSSISGLRARRTEASPATSSATGRSRAGSSMRSTAKASSSLASTTKTKTTTTAVDYSGDSDVDVTNTNGTASDDSMEDVSVGNGSRYVELVAPSPR